MRLAYADPPYPGQARRHYRCSEVDHQALINRLEADYDGWALSTSSSALQRVLAMCPPKVRVAAWVKPFAFFKPKVWPAYAWEPVIYKKPKRDCRRDAKTPVDWLLLNPHGVSRKQRTDGDQTKGQKPEAFTRWLIQMLDARPGDSLDDLFHGSGRVSAEWNRINAEWDALENGGNDDPAHT